MVERLVTQLNLPSDRVRLFCLVVGFGIAIFIVIESSMAAPSVGSPRLTEDLHVLAHLLLYGSLAFLGLTYAGRTDWRTFTLVVAATVLFGVTDEIHQVFVPSRDASLSDVVVDFAGSLSGAGLALCLNRWFAVSRLVR